MTLNCKTAFIIRPKAMPKEAKERQPLAKLCSGDWITPTLDSYNKINYFNTVSAPSID